MNKAFYVNVADLMYSRPTPKKIEVLDPDKSESLDDLPIIRVSGVDATYYTGEVIPCKLL